MSDTSRRKSQPGGPATHPTTGPFEAGSTRPPLPLPVLAPVTVVAGTGAGAHEGQAGPHAQWLNLHHFLPQSYANGPGCRAVIWVQGCTLGCPGCFNAPTHPKAGGIGQVSVDSLMKTLAALARQGRIEGVTISGGEPLQQLAGLAHLLERIKTELPQLSVILFTGFSWEELVRMGQKEKQEQKQKQPSPIAHPSLESVGAGGDWDEDGAGHDHQPAMTNATPAAPHPTGEGELPLSLLAGVDVLLAGRYVAARRIATSLLGSDNKKAYFLSNRYSSADLARVPRLELVIGPGGTITTTGIEPDALALGLKENRDFS